MGFWETVAPRYALKRAVARQHLQVLNTGLSDHGANSSKARNRAWYVRPGSADRDVSDNREKAATRCRGLFYGGSTIAAGALKRFRTNVVADGLRLDSRIDGEYLGLTPEETREAQATIEREWSLWADNFDADASRGMDFGGTQRLNYFSCLLNGDAFAMLPDIEREGRPYKLRVYSIEADRVADPPTAAWADRMSGKLRNGIEVDQYGAPIAYWVANSHPADGSFTTLIQPADWSRIPAFGDTGRRNMIHLYEPDRAGQRRGMPLLAIVLEDLKTLGDYTDSEATAALISSLYTVFVTSEDSTDPTGSMEESLMDGEEKVDDDSPATVEMRPGMVMDLAPGEKIETSNPMRPNARFAPFIEALLKQIGSALDIPFELLQLHFTSSYSASRAALLEFWKTCRTYRSWLVKSYCQPIYEEWMWEAVLTGRISAPGFIDDPAIRAAWSRAKWHGPSAGQLDPLKEVNAAEIRIRNGLSTHQQEAAELTGADFGANVKQLGQEKRAMESEGLIGMSDPSSTLADEVIEDE